MAWTFTVPSVPTGSHREATRPSHSDCKGSCAEEVSLRSARASHDRGGNKRKRFFLAAIGIVVLAGLARTTVASSDFDGLRLRTNLRGFQEVPSVSTVARGSFRALVSEDGNSIDWTLSYRDLEAAVEPAPFISARPM